MAAQAVVDTMQLQLAAALVLLVVVGIVAVVLVLLVVTVVGTVAAACLPVVSLADRVVVHTAAGAHTVVAVLVHRAAV